MAFFVYIRENDKRRRKSYNFAERNILSRLILILLIIYIIYRLLVRYILPRLVKNFLKRQQGKFFEQNPSFREEENRKEGEVKIDHLHEEPGNAKKKNIGEYVDFEDVE